MHNDKELEQAMLHKEIDLIQSCIARMSNNSFLIKGWAIMLMTAVLAFGDKLTTITYLCKVLLFPIAALWYLDAFYLQTERKYRVLYDWVIQNRYNNEHYCYSLKLDRNGLHPTKNLFCTMFSKTLWPFYFIPLLIFIGIVICSTYNTRSV